MRARPLIVAILALMAAAVAFASIALVLGAVPQMAGSVGSFGSVAGEGDVAMDTRSVASFNRIVVNGSTDVEIDAGRPQDVRVEAQPNIAALIRTDVTGDTLVVSTDRSYSTHEHTLVHIALPDLDGVKLDGSADARISGVHGSALQLVVHGSGGFTVAGETDSLSYECSGSGDGDLQELQSRAADVRIYGSGDLRLAVSDDLDVRIYGSGDVNYRGTPRVSQRILGSGTVSAD
jgi:hypothetical protein